MEEKKIDTRWYRFMTKDWFVVSMNIIRVVSLIVIVLAIIYIIKEVEAIKLLAYDPCQICMNKTGAMCYKLATP